MDQISRRFWNKDGNLLRILEATAPTGQVQVSRRGWVLDAVPIWERPGGCGKDWKVLDNADVWYGRSPGKLFLPTERWQCLHDLISDGTFFYTCWIDERWLFYSWVASLNWGKHRFPYKNRPLGWTLCDSLELESSFPPPRWPWSLHFLSGTLYWWYAGCPGPASKRLKRKSKDTRKRHGQSVSHVVLTVFWLLPLPHLEWQIVVHFGAMFCLIHSAAPLDGGCIWIPNRSVRVESAPCCSASSPSQPSGILRSMLPSGNQTWLAGNPI